MEIISGIGWFLAGAEFVVLIGLVQIIRKKGVLHEKKTSKSRRRS